MKHLRSVTHVTAPSLAQTDAFSKVCLISGGELEGNTCYLDSEESDAMFHFLADMKGVEYSR